jgi:hypothetical protein
MELQNIICSVTCMRIPVKISAKLRLLVRLSSTFLILSFAASFVLLRLLVLYSEHFVI